MNKPNKTLFLLGNGIRNNTQLVDYLLSLNVPCLNTWMSLDLIPDNHKNYCGRWGTMGGRCANAIIQKSNILFIFGCRLDDDSVAFRIDNFGKNAVKYVYDVDKAELDKLPNTSDWVKIHIDLTLLKPKDVEPYVKLSENPEWTLWCKALYTSFKSELEGKEDKKYVDVNSFVHLMSNLCEENEIIMLGSSSTAPVSFLQAFEVKKGQRVMGCSTIGSMGLEPMAIGACIANYNKRVICPTGDGSFQMNLQELEVVRRLSLPIKFIVYNNNEYSAIKNMQNARFDGRHVGSDEQSGLTLTSIKNLAKCYDIDYVRIHTLNDFTIKSIEHHMSTDCPAIIELNIDPNHVQLPKVASSLIDGKFVTDDISDMTPKLSREEYDGIMNY